MRVEALLQFALAIAFIVLWVFMPTWSIEWCELLDKSHAVGLRG